MEILAGVKTYELTSSLMWFDENGILFSCPKPEVPPVRTTEEIKKEMPLLAGV